MQLRSISAYTTQRLNLFITEDEGEERPYKDGY